jgi:NAD(P)H-quinone oxidoreductase subunit 5
MHAALLLAPAAAALVAAAAAGSARSVTAAWRGARIASIVMIAAAVAGVIVRAVSHERAAATLRADTTGVAMLALVSFVGWVVIRYSQAYLAGDPNEQRYIVRLLATIAAVTLVVVANNLIVLTLAWAATSLAMHGLLTFFSNRSVAVAVAHKKFILARCADLSLIGAIIAFGTTFGTLRIDRIAAEAATIATMPTGARIGIALVALAALLKCAQLPFHGWLIQVMEAPTPVSALLHAGVVNLGGFVLLRFAPVVDRATETRALLVIVGATTAVIAALVMTTRISIKVSLAWSTCAQMGFMLMQCGLGLWEMALLHLLAHSMYKAHAFLSAGGVVRQTQRKQLAHKRAAPTANSVAISAALSMAGTLVAGWLWGKLPFSEPPTATLWVMSGIVGLALVSLIDTRRSATPLVFRPALIGGTIAVPFAYFALHDLFGHFIPKGSAAPTALLIVVATLFALLFIVQSVCAIAPTGRLSQRLYPWIYGGLFIDEAFTRVAFAAWHPPAPHGSSGPLPLVTASPVFVVTSQDRTYS